MEQHRPCHVFQSYRGPVGLHIDASPSAHVESAFLAAAQLLHLAVSRSLAGASCIEKPSKGERCIKKPVGMFGNNSDQQSQMFSQVFTHGAPGQPPLPDTMFNTLCGVRPLCQVYLPLSPGGGPCTSLRSIYHMWHWPLNGCCCGSLFLSGTVSCFDISGTLASFKLS